jgi:hypothetical protein
MINGTFLNTLVVNVCEPFQFADGAIRRFRQRSEQKRTGRIGRSSLSPAAVQCRMFMHASSSRSFSTPQSAKGLRAQQIVGDEGPSDPV